MNLEEIVQKAKERTGVPGVQPEDGGGPSEIPWTFERDNDGREFATPIITAEEKLEKQWSRICLDFNFAVPMINENELTPYARKLRDDLTMGRKNAIMSGPPGTGKTTVALIALRELFMAGRIVKAARLTQFKTQMEPKYCDEHGVSPDTVARVYSEPEFLLLDEVGYGDTRQTIKEHERRIFFDLISVRDSMDRRTWICSNIGRDQLYEIYGEAALSRLDGVGRCIIGDFSHQPNHRFNKNKDRTGSND